MRVVPPSLKHLLHSPHLWRCCFALRCCWATAVHALLLLVLCGGPVVCILDCEAVRLAPAPLVGTPVHGVSICHAPPSDANAPPATANTLLFYTIRLLDATTVVLVLPVLVALVLRWQLPRLSGWIVVPLTPPPRSPSLPADPYVTQ